MRKSIIIILLTALVLPSMAQNWRQADSLRKALERTGTDTARINTLLRLAEFEIFKPGEFKKDLDSAAVYLEQAKRISKNIQSTDISGHIVLTEAQLAKERSQKPQGKALNERAIEILSKGTDKYLLGQAYLALAEYYNYMDPGELLKRLKLVTEAANIFKNTGHVEREAFANKMLGELDTSDAESLKHLNHSLDLYQSIHYKRLHEVYDAMGSVYLNMADYKQSLNYGLQALKIAHNVHDTTMQLCEINNHIGITYFKLEDYTEAAKYFKAALSTADAYKDVQTIYLLTTNMCEAYLRIKSPHEILSTLQHTLSKYPTTQNVAEIDCAFTSSYIEAYDMLKQYDLAKPYADHLESSIAKNRITKRTLSAMYSTLAGYFFVTKQYSREITYLMKNDTLSHQLGVALLIARNHNMWFKLDTAQHNYKAAMYHVLLRDKINDSTFTVAKNKQISQLQVQYETREKEGQINLLNQKAALQQSNLQQANLVKNVTFGGIVLLLIIAGLLYRQSRLRKKTSRIVTRKNELITQKNEQLQSLVTEKEWLLKEVHHRVKNNLHTVICLLESQAAYLENDALKAIENSEHRIYAMSLIHQKLYQSNDIKTIDMSTYIPELAQSLEDSFGTSNQIKFKLKIDPINLSLSHAIPLGLIINEAVTNSIKYAFPGNRRGEISISMTDNGKQIIMVLADNGIGMPKIDSGTESKSLGLELMKGLSKDIEADISFAVDKGTKITMRFERDALNDPEQMKIDRLTSFQTAEMG